MLFSTGLAGCKQSTSPAPEGPAISAPEQPSPPSNASPSKSADIHGQDSAPSPAPSIGSQNAPNDPADGIATDIPAPAPTDTAVDGRRSVNVVLTRWNTERPFEAGGLVTNATEASGTCTLTLWRDATSLSANGPATAGPSGMNCGEGLRIDSPNLTAGDWRAVLTYSSTQSSGTSTSQEITLS